MTGARGLLKIDGKPVGIMGGINITVEHTLSDVDVLGKIQVGDLAETGHKCNFTVNYFKFFDFDGMQEKVEKAVTDPNTQATFDDTNPYKPAQLLGIESGTVDGLKSRKLFTVEIVDVGLDNVYGAKDAEGKPLTTTEDKSVVMKMVDCKLEGGSGQMDARGIWQGTWNFRAMECVGWL